MRTPAPSDLDELVAWRNPGGILSVYLDIDPGDRSEGWRVALREKLRACADDAHRRDPHREGPAVAATTERVLARFPPANEHPPGRTQIGFVEVTARRGGREEWFGAQMDLREAALVSLDERPLLRPLVELLDDAGPMGVAIVSAERVRLLEWNLGVVREVEDWEFGTWRGDWRERKSQMPSDPARVHGVSAAGRDQHDQRVEANRERFLREAAKGIDDRIRHRHWPRVLVFGEEHVSKQLKDGLSPGRHIQHVDDRNLIWEDGRAIEERVRGSLDSLNRSRELKLVERAKSAVHAAGGRGSLGVKETLEALEQGRVEHLLFDAGRDYRGERMIEQAIATSARVTPLEGEAAEALADHEGVAAILRY